jgi:hypothetical protein
LRKKEIFFFNLKIKSSRVAWNLISSPKEKRDVRKGEVRSPKKIEVKSPKENNEVLRIERGES